MLTILTELRFPLGLAAVLTVFEYLFPWRRYASLKRDKIEDFYWLALNEILVPLARGSVLVFFSWGLFQTSTPQAPWVSLVAFPLGFQILGHLIVFDLFSYWSHRLLHTIPWLWDVHKIHHSTTTLTAFSSFRRSWIETVLIGVCQNLVVQPIAISHRAFFISTLLISATCITQHANIKLRIPRLIEAVFITPRNHLWHHSAKSYLAHGQNFGFFVTFWDRLFGSHWLPDGANPSIGLQDSQFPRAVWRRTFYPLAR